MPGVGGTTNNYEILAQLASGGMAEIFLAKVSAVVGVEKHVVLKRILPAFRDDPQMVAMFLDEARLQAQLHHPNIAQLHDVGLLGNSYFYTMEYVHGETVQSLMHKAVMRREPIPLQHVLTIAAGVAAALYHAHTRVGPDRKPLSIIHRDVSPANIMITFDGAVKLLDFGVAKSTGRMTQTRAGVVKGKVAYLSPEQIGEKGVDARSDLFSLGICLYEMLTLHGLFARSTDLATLSAIVQEMPPPPSQFRRDIPPQIDQLVMTALAKESSDRFGNADQMHQAVESAATSAKLSMSASSLGRYLGQMFGHRPEPWLATGALAAGGNDVPVTVIGDILEPALAAVEQVHDEAFERKAREVDQRISRVRKVPQFDESDLAYEDQITGKRPQLSSDALPPAAEHPQWESTVIRTPMPEGLDLTRRVPASYFADLDAAETSLAAPRYVPPNKPVLNPSAMPQPPQQMPPAPPPPPAPVPQSGPQPSPMMQSGGPRQSAALIQSGGQMQGGGQPLMQSGGHPPLQRPSLPAMPDARPVGVRPQPQAWEPSTYRTQAPKPDSPGASWNVPRIVLVAAFLVAIVLAIWIAVT